MEPIPVGGQWLKEKFRLVNFTLTHSSYIADNASMHLTALGNVERYFIKTYQVNDPQDALHHIEFYLKYDDLDLDFLHAVFANIPDNAIAAFIDKTPAGKPERKIGYLYEYLCQHTLPVTKPTTGNYFDLLDSDKYYVGGIIRSTRWHVDDNMLGDRRYCPIIRKTSELKKLLSKDLAAEINELKSKYGNEIFDRATSYLYTKETRSSYQIEKETPSPDRLQKFISILTKAGSQPNAALLSKERLVLLQNAIVDSRYASKDYRNFQNYVGASAGFGREDYHYVCPPPEIVQELMEGLQIVADRTSNKLPAEIRAAMLSFGFVFIHPFEDGNGRLHRFLIHDVLALDGKVPEGVIIPVSAHMLNNMRAYDGALEKYSKPLIDRIKIETTVDTGIIIKNADQVKGYFRYPDLTAQCAYLVNVIHQTITEDMPEELDFLIRYDDIKKAVQNIVDMPDAKLRKLLNFLHGNKGLFPKRRRDEFRELTDDEIKRMEAAYHDIFDTL
ncbi:Fic family protein [Deminuibacter soli]|uniref:Fic family protein n=1 Tax=Deminuibacter soli TaxID=2291815 RepID=A0A3E1NL77_9BACT|nr:Fic family protein [Deminuibacter soli]RFM28538.1 Fic family protein [Deminuibacter soli]